MRDLSGFHRVESPPLELEAARDEVLALVAEPLLQVEHLLRLHLASPVRIVDEIGGFVAQSGGKRVRPTLLLLCAKACGYQGTQDVLLGTVVEFIHCATLIHDDIIDEATRRRGRPSVNHHWGNQVTVLFGDYMFAKAMDLALEAGSLRVMQLLADVTLRMTEGEMLQTRYLGRLDLTVDEYLDLVERKTAALFACCCQLGGLLGEVGAEGEAALRDYGSNLGLAFQLVDDVLDFTGDAETLGKPAASDLREGKATMAVLDLLAGGSNRARRLAQRIMDGSSDGGADIRRLTEMLRENGAIDRARDRAREHARRAASALERFAPGPAREALRQLPELLLLRDR